MKLSQFDEMKSPVVVINKQGQVLYRNKEALKISRCLKRNGKVLPYLHPQGEEQKSLFENKKPTLVSFHFPYEYSAYDAAFFPLFDEEGCFVLLFFSSLFTEREKENATLMEQQNVILGKLLRDAFYASLTFDDEKFQSEWTMEHACMFLNKMGNDFFGNSGIAMDARFSKECVDMVLFQFAKLMPALSLLSLLLLYCSDDRFMKFRMYCEKDCPVLFFHFQTKNAETAKDLFDLMPDRFPELTLATNLLATLLFHPYSFYVEENRVTLCFKNEKPLPVYKFRSKNEDEKMQLKNQLSDLYHCIFKEEVLNPS